MKGPDGVRSRDRQRLEFEYSTTPLSWRIADDIQNYNPVTFFESLLPGVKASPPTGAVSGRYDIAEVEETLAMTRRLLLGGVRPDAVFWWKQL